MPVRNTQDAMRRWAQSLCSQYAMLLFNTQLSIRSVYRTHHISKYYSHLASSPTVRNALSAYLYQVHGDPHASAPMSDVASTEKP